MAYPNLKAEMGRNDVSIESLAKALKIHRNSVAYKLNKDGAFSIEEADTIQKQFFPNIPLTVFFKRK